MDTHYSLKGDRIHCGLENSKKLFIEAKKYLVGGVNSPVRAFKAVGRNPIFVKRAGGSKIYDVDDNEYIDLVCSWGALILGHSHPRVTSAVKKSLSNGTSYGISTEIEIKLAKEITKAIKSIKKIRMVNSGTEATMSAIRLLRGFTKKNKIIKFDGCYHGHSDSLLVKAGSGATTFSIPDSEGIPKEIVRNTISVPYNNLFSFEKIVKKEKDIAGVIVEPVAANMGLVLPESYFLKDLREITEENDILLIFDEVITGFRLCYGGAQDYYKIKPDLTCLGKIIGGGFSVGAFGGREDIMDMLSPEGHVYQAGTLSGNPVAMTAGYETLRILKKGNIYADLRKKSELLRNGLSDIITDSNTDIFLSGIESMLCVFFTANKVYDYESAKKSDTEGYSKFFNSMLNSGILTPPSQFETMFLSTAHKNSDIEKILGAFNKYCRSA